MNDEIQLVKGSDNPFRDAGIAHADTELMKADLAAEIVRILRERELTGAEAAKLTGVQAADISRIRKADLDRFTLDRLVRILKYLDQRIHLRIEIRLSVRDAEVSLHP
jgi:predicted XRE-type DNA-binding protein